MSRTALTYAGIVAETYDLLVTTDAIGDADYFRAVIRDHGEPALELGCGTGRLLLDYVAEGLDVEGVDASPEMLSICRRKAKQRGLTAAAHRQAMQSLGLARRFRTLFIPAGSFMLVIDPTDAERALARFYAHLVPGGQLFIALEQPSGTMDPDRTRCDVEWRLRRQGIRSEDGATVRVLQRVHDDVSAQLRSSVLRYEVTLGGRTIGHHEATQTTRWYTPAEGCQLLERAGFAEAAARSGYTSRPAGPTAKAFVCVGRRLKR
jgi:SAM-dependent methyltransferase